MIVLHIVIVIQVSCIEGRTYITSICKQIAKKNTESEREELRRTRGRNITENIPS
jgi:hypothetical protein